MSDFLYPFLSGDAGDRTAVLEELSRSARQKLAASVEVRRRTLEELEPEVDAAARAIADRFAAGGRMLTFGNGGSAADAAGLASLFADPPRGEARPAQTLAGDLAVLTALGNDVGYDLVFSRQLIAVGRPADVAVGLSTSGNSSNLLAAFGEARRLGMLTIGFAGYGGGAMADAEVVDHLFVVRSDSVHRIQEAQDAVCFQLWQAVAAYGRGS